MADDEVEHRRSPHERPRPRRARTPGPSAADAVRAPLFPTVPGSLVRRAPTTLASEPSAGRRTLVTDALLYGGSLGFTVLVVTGSSVVTHRLWAGLATVAYGAGAAGCAVLAWRRRSIEPRALSRARAVILGVVVGGAVLLPLAVAVALRDLVGPAFTHDEVLTTERAGASLLEGASPYDHTSTPADAEPRRFPYLPLMAAFGLPRALSPAPAVTDARVWFLAVALAVAGAALVIWAPTPEVTIRVVQLTVALPTGAMGAVAGGHDLVVLSLMLASLGLHRAGRLGGSALVASLAGLLKATAWPLWIALGARWALSGRRTQSGRAIGLRLAVLPAGLAAMAVWDGPGLFADTILFPLGGLSRVALRRSPEWADVVPEAHSAVMLALAGMAILTAVAILLTAVLGGSTSSIARAAASIAAAGVLLAGPAARPGLLLYPALLAMWSFLLARPLSGAGRTREIGGGAHGHQR